MTAGRKAPSRGSVRRTENKVGHAGMMPA